jgi:hypothetical protein
VDALTAAPTTFDELRSDDANFPHAALVGCETALVLFGAGFYGRQDAFWVAEAGLHATVVDTDQKRLDAMEDVYPEDWEFVCADAFIYAKNCDRQWDVVTLDPFTNTFDRCADNIRQWCKLARYAVIMGTGANTVVQTPEGWHVTAGVRRSDYAGGVFWTVLEAL